LRPDEVNSPGGTEGNQSRWAKKRQIPMANEEIEPPSGVDEEYFVRLLVEETGITERQARDLIALLGYEWTSLLREAHILAKKR
jgi:hypothetical protein